ncbi:hypothetical protein [Celeribacter halophilus]|uniref:hypothetical protein n=1 Tax=Celeribacter halophilus TaxID=576117 RepID=UPI003A8E3EBE
MMVAQSFMTQVGTEKSTRIGTSYSLSVGTSLTVDVGGKNSKKTERILLKQLAAVVISMSGRKWIFGAVHRGCFLKAMGKYTSKARIFL